MAGPAARELKTGRIISETLAAAQRSIGPVLIFIVIIAALNSATGYFGLGYTSAGQEVAKGVLASIIGIVGAYFLFERMLTDAGYRSPKAEDAFVPYVGLAIIYTLAVGLGLLVIILPGLILIARWSVAQPLLIVRGQGVMRALKDSWERTKGSEFTIILAAIVLLGLPIAISIIAGIVLGREDPVGIVVAQIASAVSSALGISFGVALYGLIVAQRGAVAPSIDPPATGA